MKMLKSLSRKITLEMNLLKEILIASIDVCLLVSVGYLSIQQIQASVLPSGIVYSVPITLTTTQSVPTVVPFKQMLNLNNAAYSSYEALNP